MGVRASSPMNTQGDQKTPELLAPAGNIESFMAALRFGADAVYLGLKQFSARASAENFTLDELALLIPYAHKRGVSVYVALNSLVTATEVPQLLNLLQSLSDLKADALITQDPGVFALRRKHFPHVPLHGSTLMAVHNSAGVGQLARMGAARAVLARESTLREIGEICARSEIPIEVFVHGALCYSYSGMCLASSFRGGHSGLQGHCVQPCRLRFRQGNREGFFLSCNDFCALSFIPQLKRMGVAAVKIEGRMKSGDAVGSLVNAYRMVLDASDNEVESAIARAQELVAQVPSRRLTSGFLSEHPGVEILSPHRSGSTGVWVGTVRRIEGDRLVVGVRRELSAGDRLRPESSEGREKKAFTVKEIHSGNGMIIERGRTGETILLPLREEVSPGDRLFKVGNRAALKTGSWNEVRKEVGRGLSYRKAFRSSQGSNVEIPHQRDTLGNPRGEERLYLKVSRVADVFEALKSNVHMVLLTATRNNLEQMVKRRLSRTLMKRLGWSLPPVLFQREAEYTRAAVKWYVEKGYRSWEVNNWGHLDFFAEQGAKKLIGGWRLNVRNHEAVEQLAESGCDRVALSLEITERELEFLAAQPFRSMPIVTVHAWPPVFISRLIPELREDKPFITPRKESYLYRKKGGLSCIYADRPSNWFGKLVQLRSMGFREFMVDASDGPHDQPADIQRLLKGYVACRPPEPHSLFNYERNPQYPSSLPSRTPNKPESRPNPGR